MKIPKDYLTEKIFVVYFIIAIFISLYVFYLNDFQFSTYKFECEDVNGCKNQLISDHPYIKGLKEYNRACDLKPYLCEKEYLKYGEVLKSDNDFIYVASYYIYGLFGLALFINHIWYIIYIKRNKHI